MAKIQLFCLILEDAGYGLAGRRTMFNLIPFINEQEQSKIKEEMKSRKVGVIFNGTTTLGEALAIIIHSGKCAYIW